jgi:hypothetical protein
LTIGIEAMLVTRLGDSPEDSARIVNLNRAISDSHGSIQKAMNIELDLVDKKVNRKGSLDEQAIFERIHAAAFPVLVQELFWRCVLLALVALTALALLFLAARNDRVLEALGGNSKYLVTGAFLGAACALFGTMLWFFERRFSFDFMSPMASTESLIVYFARGMKSESLMTLNGQLVALLALAVIATLVHSLNSDPSVKGSAGGRRR